MLTLTRKADYALVAMAELARRFPGRASAREVAVRSHVPLPMLHNILKQLLHEGLVTSTMGPAGGYSLARAPEQISLADMIDAMEGRFKLTLCCSTDCETDAGCELEPDCQIKGSVRKVHAGMRHFMSGFSLAQIAFDDVPVPLGLSDRLPNCTETEIQDDQRN